jgi:hypothetical protein
MLKSISGKSGKQKARGNLRLFFEFGKKAPDPFTYSAILVKEKV